MLPTDKCEDFQPLHILQRRLDSVPISTLVFSSVPLIISWIAVAAIAHRRLFPVLSGDALQSKATLPSFNKDASKTAGYNLREQLRRPSAGTLASLVFSASIALSTVLVELLLCEISNTLNPAARGLALRLTLTSLLLLIVLVTPALELHGLAKTVLGAPTETTSTRRNNPRLRLALETFLFAAWLAVFWYIPQASILRSSLRDSGMGSDMQSTQSFTEACLSRIGIIGISLMASLSGFAAVSSLWQTFGVRHKAVRESDIQRKEGGLNATVEMLAAKQSRLRALQRKMSEATASPSSQTGFMGRVIGSIRGGNADMQEEKAVQMEVSGLETVRYQLSTSLSNLRSRHAAQERSRTSTGRLLNLANTIFSVYCAYRIVTTSLATLRRFINPSHSSASADPINNILALLTTHWDSNLDRAAWSRQISFLLSGVMLLASFSSVLQTFRLFARFAPTLLQRAEVGLPLVISQVAGAYVISSALLLRSNLPEEVGGVFSDALGAPLEGRFVEGWFESWFLVAVGLTATGILVGRKVGSGGNEWDDDEGFAMGKRS